MISVLGIQKNIPLQIREKFSIKQKVKEKAMKELKNSLDEIVILNTCNRTEIYFKHSLKEEEALKKIFEVLEWDENLREYIFYITGDSAAKHLFKVICGFHSKILGEDQILGQVKDAYMEALEFGTVNLELQRLFQEAITCGKKFRNEAKLYEIPVSSASIAVNKGISNECKSFMVLGHGEVGKLVVKHLLSHNTEEIIIAVRNKESLNYEEYENIKIIGFNEREEYINKVDSIISCTSAPHTVITKNEIREDGKELLIFDLALPRDVSEEVKDIDRVSVYNIDEISKVDDENKDLRKDRMYEYYYLIDEYLDSYNKWRSLREVTPYIRDFKKHGDEIYKKRYDTFKNKEGKEDKLVKMLMKSTSDAYVNRAIETLKEETIRGCGKECMRILEKIFIEKN
ncbi:glutamyl-tRNA reductase [Eubacterium multiforme]|uniref:Glutamyl-tRNA reductase n=1 Tax=Eubacterium multiforme TaxID=83339 RepID=A0ABT9UTH0_9FIRM|nr:glutamyl-tRNA reductase [Eubacterium multiforme]MDQ0149591.1 glutamyl-tRNA reductase [Eubacterium multiforme]